MEAAARFGQCVRHNSLEVDCSRASRWIFPRHRPSTRPTSTSLASCSAFLRCKRSVATWAFVRPALARSRWCFRLCPGAAARTPQPRPQPALLLGLTASRCTPAVHRSSRKRRNTRPISNCLRYLHTAATQTTKVRPFPAACLPPRCSLLAAFFGWGGGHALLRQQSHPTEWTVASWICSGSRDAGAHAGDAAETQAPHNRAVGEQKQGRPLVLVLGCVAPGSRRQRGQVCARSCPLAYWRRRQAGVCRRHCSHAYARGALAGPPGGVGWGVSAGN